MASDTELNVKIGAETADLERGVNKAKSEIQSASNSIKNDLSEMALSAKNTIAAFVGFEAIKDVIETAINFDSLRMSLNATTGSAEKGAESFEYIRQTSERLGLNLQSTAESFKTIAGATMGTKLEGEKARDIFLSVSEAAAVMGLSSEDTKGALLALGQMISKGTVSSEELRGQLGERIPGAFQIAAQAAGVTTAELQKMLEQGMIPADEFLPKFAQAMHDRFAKDVPNAANSARASMERFKNSITELKVALAESGILEFAELLMRGWSYMASIISIAVKSLASTIVGAWGDIYTGWNEIVIGGILKSTERINRVLPDAMKIDTSGLRSSYEEGASYSAKMQAMADKLDASSSKTAMDLMNRIRGAGGVSMPSLEGDYKIGGMTPFSGKKSKAADKEAEREAEREAREQERREAQAAANYMAAAERRKQIKFDEIEYGKQMAMIGVQADIDALNLKKEYENVSLEEELTATKAIEEKKYQIELMTLQKRAELYKIGSVELAKANSEILLLQTKHAAQIEGIDNRIAKSNKNMWSDMGENMKDSFGSTIGNLINFTTTWKDAFTGLIKDMLAQFTQFIGKKVVAWTMGETTMTGATALGTASRLGMEMMASIQSVSISAAAAVKKMAIYMWEAAAGAYAAMASIPWVGPVLAPVAAGAMIAGVGALIGNIASAEGGYDIPAGVNPVTQLHEQEMVLPKAQANAIRDMADGGGVGGATNITIHAVDAKSVEKLFRDHGSSLVKSLKAQGRNFNS